MPPADASTALEAIGNELRALREAIENGDHGPRHPDINSLLESIPARVQGAFTHRPVE